MIFGMFNARKFASFEVFAFGIITMRIDVYIHLSNRIFLCLQWKLSRTITIHSIHERLHEQCHILYNIMYTANALVKIKSKFNCAKCENMIIIGMTAEFGCDYWECIFFPKVNFRSTTKRYSLQINII